MQHPPCTVFFSAVGLVLYTVLLGVFARDGICFYRAMLAAMVEDLCLDPQHALQPCLRPSFPSTRLWNPAQSLITSLSSGS